MKVLQGIVAQVRLVQRACMGELDDPLREDRSGSGCQPRLGEPAQRLLQDHPGRIERITDDPRLRGGEREYEIAASR